jgi:Flp pilus assembly protein TadD/transglutaminase-like putative cysteine protease
VVISAFALQLAAQTKIPEPPDTASYQNEAVVVEKFDTSVTYQKDGTGEKRVSMRMKITSEAGARQFSVVSYPYASANEVPEVEMVVVHHPDGSSTETPAADAMEVPAPITLQAPLYSDLKLLQIPIRSLRAGDTLEYRVGIQRKNAEAPSQFWDAFSFIKDHVVLSEGLTLDVPVDKYVQVWSPAVKPVIAEVAGRRVYNWSSSQLKPTTVKNKKDDNADEPFAHTKPDVAWTTFHTWQEVGEWYRALSAPRAAPTEALRARADEITRDAKTPEEQVRALYSFVSSRIRYIGIDFGIGRYQPHAAPEVLLNQYGDCKDKDTLLQSLLRAKGFTTASALIGANLDVVQELPSPAFFNHVITTVTLEPGRIWMDSTPGVAPFQLLVAPLRDKDALVIPLNGVPALERTPARPPFAFEDHFEAKGTLNADGEFKATVNIDFRSDQEIIARALSQNLAPAQWDQGTQFLANLLGFSGTTSNSSFGRADDTGPPIHVSYDYTKKPFGDWDNLRILALLPANDLPASPEKQTSQDLDLGAARTELAVSRIRLPEGYGADLPDAVHAKTGFATFDKTYKLENGELITERKIAVLQPKLPAGQWDQYKKFAKDISLGDETWVQLTAVANSAKGPHPPTPGENNPAAARLVSKAVALERNRDWGGALAELDKASKLQPEQPFLWSNYGYLAMVQNRPDEARADYKHELEHHPDETFVVNLYGRFLLSLGEKDEALRMAKPYFERDPADPQIAMLLASIQSGSSLGDAIATLRRAHEANPEDRFLETSLANYLVRNHQDGEAAEVARKLLSAATGDPNALNNGAYLLAEANGDLVLAEQKSRESLDILDSQTSQIGIGEANRQSFNRSSLLTASWDTLGYILEKEKKLDEAADYLEAAWNNRLGSAAVGLHYGELLEAQGKQRDALRIYELAWRRPGQSTPDPTEQAVRAGISRMTSAGMNSTVGQNGQSILQEQRTFKLKLTSPYKSYWSGTYRLQFSAGRGPDIQLVEGKSEKDGIEDAIRKLNLPHLVPSHSNGRIVRDAVLSCSPGQAECFFVLMPMGSIDAEHPRD